MSVAGKQDTCRGEGAGGRGGEAEAQRKRDAKKVLYGVPSRMTCRIRELGHEDKVKIDPRKKTSPRFLTVTFHSLKTERVT